MPSAPHYLHVLMFLVTLRSLFVLTPPSIPLPDCDEVFNYYEPLHFLLYGTGLQTWEYAPNFALRTVAFLKPLQLVLGAFSAAVSALPFLPATTCEQLLSKPSLFHLCRLLLSLATATAEALGLPRKTFYDRLQKLAIRPEDFRE